MQKRNLKHILALVVFIILFECILGNNSGNIDRIKEETADLLYHLLVLLSEKNIPLNDIMTVLSDRHKK